MGLELEGCPSPSPSLQGRVFGSRPLEPLEPKGPRESQLVAGSAPSFCCGDSPWSEEVPGSAFTLRACGIQKRGPSGIPILLPEGLATVLLPLTSATCSPRGSAAGHRLRGGSHTQSLSGTLLPVCLMPPGREAIHCQTGTNCAEGPTRAWDFSLPKYTRHGKCHSWLAPGGPPGDILGKT